MAHDGTRVIQTLVGAGALASRPTPDSKFETLFEFWLHEVYWTTAVFGLLACAGTLAA